MNEGRIVLTRSSEYRDLLRRYRVLVDGAEVASLRRGETVEIPVAEGMHTLQVRIDWTGSSPLDVHVTDGKCARFRVHSSGKAGAGGLAPEGWLTISAD